MKIKRCKTIEYQTGVCGMNYGGADYYFQKNMLGDVCAIYNSAGELQCRYVYDAWGNHKIYDKEGNQIPENSSPIGSINPFRYRGYYWDKEFGLYYLKSRYYDPEVGRFISPDSIEYLDPASITGMNLYAYCGNNPVMYTDPEGCAEWWEIVLGVLVVASVAAATVLAAAGIASVVSSAAIAAVAKATAMGAVITGGVGLAMQAATGEKKIDYGSLAWDTFVGGVSGAISGAFSGAFRKSEPFVYFYKQIFINTLIYPGVHVLSSAIIGKKPTVMDLFTVAAGGALNGMVSGLNGGWGTVAAIILSLIATLFYYWETFWELILS